MSLVASVKEKKHAATSVTATIEDMPIGETIDKMHELREKKRKLEAQIKELEGEFDGLSETLMTKLEAQKLDGSRGSKASVSISKSVVANVMDWDAFHAFIKKTGYFHLMQRRVSEPAFRELLEQKGEAAMKKVGVEPFFKKTILLKSL